MPNAAPTICSAGSLPSRRCSASSVWPSQVDLNALARVEIANAADGAPDPKVDGSAAPVSLSMTDRAGWAVCLLGPPGRSLGCDLELVEPRTELFIRDYLTAREAAAVMAHPAGRAPRPRRQPRLVGQGKRAQGAAYRAAPRYPLGRSQLRSAGEPRVGRRWRSPSTTSASFPGWWQRFGDFVLTVAADDGRRVADAGPAGRSSWTGRQAHRHTDGCAAPGLRRV